MKKIISIAVLGLLLSGNAYADTTMEQLLNDKYKITNEELVKFDRYAQKIFTLKKGNQVKICTVKIMRNLGISSLSKCMTP